MNGYILDIQALLQVLFTPEGLANVVVLLFSLVFEVYLLAWLYHELLSLWQDYQDSNFLGGKRFNFLNFDNEESDGDEIDVMINGRYRKFKSNKSKSSVVALNDVFSRDVATPDDVWADVIEIGKTPGGELNDKFSRDVATPDDVYAGKFYEEKSPFRWWHDDQPSGLNDAEFMARDVVTADDRFFDVEIGDTSGGDLSDPFSRDVALHIDYMFPPIPYSTDETNELIALIDENPDPDFWADCENFRFK